MEYSYFTKDTFRAEMGWDLDQVIPNDHDPGSKATRFIKRVCEAILGYIEKQMSGSYFDRANLTQYQVDTINEAAMEQANYVLGNADFSLVSGYDQITNTIISHDSLLERAIAPDAKRILDSHIIYRRL